MKINTKIIKKLGPCGDRFDNYLKHYKDFDGDIEDFVMLEKITFEDKVWVISELFNKKQNVKWSIMMASMLLSDFEEKHPNDNRPRLAIEAVEAWLADPSKENARAAGAAWAAAGDARDASWAAAGDAAEAAWAAAEAAYTAYWAARAAWAAADDARAAAAWAAGAAARAAARASGLHKDLVLMFAVEAARDL